MLLRTLGTFSYIVSYFCLCPIVEVCTPPAFGVNIPESSIIKWKWSVIMFLGDSLVMKNYPVQVKCL